MTIRIVNEQRDHIFNLGYAAATPGSWRRSVPNSSCAGGYWRSAADPLTFITSSATALLVTLLACYMPARRAAAISPAELLRE